MTLANIWAFPDPAQLAQMLTDLVGLVGSVLWLAWPERLQETRFA
jgi:hypothetical protein